MGILGSGCIWVRLFLVIDWSLGRLVFATFALVAHSHAPHENHV
jgi:hypothetical protein